MRVYVRREACIGAATCVGIAPEVFELDDEEGKARVKDPHAGKPELLEYAAEQCPSGAIVAQHFTDRQVHAMIDAFFEVETTP